MMQLHLGIQEKKEKKAWSCWWRGKRTSCGVFVDVVHNTKRSRNQADQNKNNLLNLANLHLLGLIG